jgi:hypothetical protein
MNGYRSQIFEIADRYTNELVKFSPILATDLGVPGFETKLDDFSLAANKKRTSYQKEILVELLAMNPTDEIDRIAKTVMVERVSSDIQTADSLEEYAIFGAIQSPVSSIRQVFELMEHESAEDFANIALRLHQVPTAFESWKSLLLDVAAAGKTAARRQALGVADQLKVYANGNYQSFVKSIDPQGKYPELMAGALIAEQSCLELENWMRSTYAPLTNSTDAVGIERYGIWAQKYTGAKLNLREVYEWGIADLAQINERMWRAAAKIKPQAKSLREVADFLESDPKYVIHGTDALLAKLREFTDAAVEQLDGIHFDIDPRIKFCDARLAPEGASSAAYYIQPSEDLSRPGTTWFPTLGKDEFSFWHIASTWYHEALPGHHLQCATVIIEKERLSRFQISEAWISGYGEGWALYAERLMDEIGAFSDPGFEMGYLSGQALRAARIVVDIGMHLGYQDFDGEIWNAESAYKILYERALLDEDSSRDEVDRYLAIPGQAISYKVGERFWLEAREAAKTRLGDRFDLKAFHSFALRIGPMGLDAFASELANWENVRSN